VHWEAGCRANHSEVPYQFLPVIDGPPDTNIFCFVVQRKGNRSLERMNAIGEAVYKQSSISPDLGEQEHSYSQPFFLSRTHFHLPHYSANAVAGLLARAVAAAV
jgi:hypothetical protein